VFEPTAINLHYHKHTIESFMQRQYKEGRSRVHLAVRYPEFAANLLSPKDIRGSDSVVIAELHAALKKLQFVPQANIDDQLTTLMLACSFAGVKETLVGPLQAIRYANDAEFPAYVVSAHKAIGTGDTGYVEHCIQWALQKEPNNFATYGFVGECYLAIGEKTEALFAFRKALEMNHENTWIKERYEELR